MCLRSKEETGKLERLTKVCLGVHAGPGTRQRPAKEVVWKKEQVVTNKGKKRLSRQSHREKRE